ncbi:MlaE family ABC transporter permease [Rhodoferax saidenbachensis]|uniref:ABC transporter permease n=1 Tax=Rhodoferax saidenbachensis TaxID=1484693 RepID=A0A1P8KCG5_9BURK|nr:ABC transporter permease [Rhodoferax saidenbachensis]APW43701.1 ABC transporter permease [Rhodoferax saidenbachensis]
MTPNSPLHLAPHAWGRAVLRGALSWWHLLHFSAMVMVLALSPSSYDRTSRVTLSRHMYTSTWQVLPWFTVLSALLSLVLIRIVLVTALSYGLSHYALQMVVRVLVLELIPLAAALYVALRAGLAFNAGAAPQVGNAERLGLHELRTALMPRALADAFSVLALAMVSSAIALVLAYLSVHGFTLWGLQGYTRTVGQVFDLFTTLTFVLKAVGFSLAVALVPLAASVEARRVPVRDSTVQPGAVRLFLVLLLIEAAFLTVRYI